MNTSPNTTPIITRARHASSIGLIAAITLAGCAHAPLRQPTAMFDQIRSIGEMPPGVALPVAISTVAPKYPERLICAGVEGSVWVSCWVNRNGEPEDISALHASEPDFAKAAIEAVKQWRFAPGSRDGRTLGMWVAIPFQFAPKFPAESGLRRS